MKKSKEKNEETEESLKQKKEKNVDSKTKMEKEQGKKEDSGIVQKIKERSKSGELSNIKHKNAKKRKSLDEVIAISTSKPPSTNSPSKTKQEPPSKPKEATTTVENRSEPEKKKTMPNISVLVDPSKNKERVRKEIKSHVWDTAEFKKYDAEIRAVMLQKFALKDLMKMYKRFKMLDSDASGSISTSEFLSVPEIASNPLVKRVTDILDSDKDGEIDFKEFIKGVSIFCVEAEKEARLKFAFQIYDIDGDGSIANGELFQVLKMMVGPNLTDTQVQQIVNRTILYSDNNVDGRVSFKEFCNIIGDTTNAFYTSHVF